MKPCSYTGPRYKCGGRMVGQSVLFPEEVSRTSIPQGWQSKACREESAELIVPPRWKVMSRPPRWSPKSRKSLRRRIFVVYWKQWKKPSMRAWCSRRESIRVGQFPQGGLAHCRKPRACRHAHHCLSSSEGMGMPAGHLPKVSRSMTIGNRSPRNRTVVGVGGRCGDAPRLLPD